MIKNASNIFGHGTTQADYLQLDADVENGNLSSAEEPAPLHVVVEVKEPSVETELCPPPEQVACPGLQNVNVSDEDNLNEEDNENTPLSPLPHKLNLHIPGRTDCWKASCDLDWKVAEAKKRLFPKESQNMRIRMICRGKEIADDSARLGDSVEDGGHLHVSITARRTPDEEEGETTEVASENQDVLLQDFLLATRIANEEPAWNEENPQDRRMGTNVEFVLFATAGMFLGFIMLIFLFQYRITRKKRLGILVGVSIHMMITFSGIDIYSIP
jgi:hypothetical protein